MSGGRGKAFEGLQRELSSVPKSRAQLFPSAKAIFHVSEAELEEELQWLIKEGHVIASVDGTHFVMNRDYELDPPPMHEGIEWLYARLNPRMMHERRAWRIRDLEQFVERLKKRQRDE